MTRRKAAPVDRTNVVPFKGSVQSSKKELWLGMMARAFDRHVRTYGAEPESMIALLQSRKTIVSIWDMKRSTEPNRELLMASEHLRREADAGND